MCQHRKKNRKSNVHSPRNLKIHLIFLTDLVLIISKFDENSLSLSDFLNFGNRKKLYGAKSEEYSECRISSCFCSCDFAIAAADMWARALSWCERILFLAKCRRLLLIFRSTRSDSSAKYPPLIISTSSG